VIGALAAAQGGRVSREQLLRQGIGASAIDHRVRSGRLHLVHRGVYAVGHPAATITGEWWAALLACGDEAVLSHATAACACELMDRPGPRVHVTTARTGIRAPSGVLLHRSRCLYEHERTEVDGMPVTTAARTILDLAATLPVRRLEQLLDRAEARKLVSLEDLTRAIADHPGRRGTPRLRAVLAAYTPTVTRSELEERFLELCDRHAVRRPVMNAWVDGFEVDAHWPAARLVVELDGYAFHRSPTAFETDRARDVALTVAGWRVVRFTYRQIADEPARVAATIRRLRLSAPS
jgi:very-short-patch-repair endonuclease